MLTLSEDLCFMSFESVQERSMCEYATHMTLVINPLYTFLEYVLWQNVKSCTYVKMCGCYGYYNDFGHYSQFTLNCKMLGNRVN